VPTALIVGAAGQDGRLLAPMLLDRGYAVRGWVRSEVQATLPCECALVSVLDSASVEREFRKLRPDEIYYLAAFHHSTEDPLGSSTGELLRQSFDVHVVGLLNVLEIMKARYPQARLFYASSSHVFGRATAEWQDERTPLRPDSAYGISKAAGMHCCQFYRQHEGIFAATGILFNHESPLRKRSFLSQKIVRGALQAERDPEYRLILGDLEARVDWGYAPDYVDAMWRILQLSEANDFVIASGETHTVREFAQAAFAAVGLDWNRYVQTDARLLNRRPYFLRGNFAKLRAATGWSPMISFVNLVEKLVRETAEDCEIISASSGEMKPFAAAALAETGVSQTDGRTRYTV
jgi:GDPmannose 4,6-dehydratase